MGTLDDLIDLASGRPGGLAQRSKVPSGLGTGIPTTPRTQAPKLPQASPTPDPSWLGRLAAKVEIQKQLAPRQRAIRNVASSASRALGTAQRAMARAGGHGFAGSVRPQDIVNVGGINVHRNIAGNIQNLLAHAARDGVNLTGGGYRSIQDQARLYNAWKAGTYKVPAVARPGRSRHGSGQAIDFKGVKRGSREFQWLQQNAARYGLHNLPSEPWHWSVDGR